MDNSIHITLNKKVNNSLDIALKLTEHERTKMFNTLAMLSPDPMKEAKKTLEDMNQTLRSASIENQAQKAIHETLDYSPLSGISQNILSKSAKATMGYKDTSTILEELNKSLYGGGYQEQLKTLQEESKQMIKNIRSLSSLGCDYNALPNVADIFNKAFLNQDSTNIMLEKVTKRLNSSFAPLVDADFFKKHDRLISSVLNQNYFNSFESIESTMLEMLNSINQDSLNIEENDTFELQEIDAITATIKESKTFLESFQSLPQYLQMIIMYVFLELFTPIVPSTISNVWVTPYVQNISDTDKVRIIKKSGKKRFDSIHSLRFINAHNVHIRDVPSTSNNKSKVLGKLQLGNVVEVISKKKNWIEVSFKNENISIRGWVFTRYTSKFKN